VAVPTRNDIQQLIAYVQGSGAYVRAEAGPAWRCYSQSGGIARLHYDLAAEPIPFGEPFLIGCEMFLHQQWGGGGTILRVESGPVSAGEKLWRTELNVFSDGYPHVVRNCHPNQGGALEYLPLHRCAERLPVGRRFKLDMSGVLSTENGKALTVVSVDGREIGRTTTANVTPGQGTPKPYTRARYCQVQGPGNAVTTVLYAAYLRPADGSPPPPATDPCADVKTQLAAAQQQLDAQRALTVTEKTRADAAEAKLGSVRAIVG
jgi:hypothetical protein